MSVAYIEGGLDVSKSTNLTILNNTIQGNISYGISLGNSNSTVISENRVIGGGVNVPFKLKTISLARTLGITGILAVATTGLTIRASTTVVDPSRASVQVLTG